METTEEAAKMDPNLNPETIAPDNSPKILFERNEFGLLKHVNYTYKEDGSIDWRKLVKPEFLAIKRDKQREGEDDVTKYEDKDLLILLAGLKELAQIRGYSSLKFIPSSSNLDFVHILCEIAWLPNYETEGRTVIFQSSSGASIRNTDGMGLSYIAETAENRAFARCIRNFLKINIVSKEEMNESINNQSQGQTQSSEAAKSDLNPTSPHGMLQGLLTAKNITFEKVKAKFVEKQEPGASEWEQLTDIPTAKVFAIIEKLKNPKKSDEK